MIRQSHTGNGTVFLTAGGTVITTTLAENETIVVDSGSIVGFQDSVSYSVRLAGGPFVICFGGEGCCSNTLTGPGQGIIIMKY